LAEFISEAVYVKTKEAMTQLRVQCWIHLLIKIGQCAQDWAKITSCAIKWRRCQRSHPSARPRKHFMSRLFLFVLSVGITLRVGHFDYYLNLWLPGVTEGAEYITLSALDLHLCVRPVLLACWLMVLIINAKKSHFQPQSKNRSYEKPSSSKWAVIIVFSSWGPSEFTVLRWAFSIRSLMLYIISLVFIRDTISWNMTSDYTSNQLQTRHWCSSFAKSVLFPWHLIVSEEECTFATAFRTHSAMSFGRVIFVRHLSFLLGYSLKQIDTPGTCHCSRLLLVYACLRILT
jgi:hypothetical protein